MINGAHFILFSKDAEADRGFLRDVLDFTSVDAGRGWLIFALPPAEIAIHPAEGTAPAVGEDGVAGASLYLMCDDLGETLKMLEAQGVESAPVERAPWGSFTTLGLPSGSRIGIYQPTHPTAI